MKEGIVNISEKYKFFLWLPKKTGSNHAWFVFKHFDTESIFYKNDSIKQKSDFKHNHSLNFFPQHENYIFISTARNPFNLFISYFKFTHVQNQKDFNSVNFKNFFKQKIDNKEIQDFFANYKFRKPDYFLRLENLWSDYTNIPFIRNSKLYQSGILYEMCKSKINSSPDYKSVENFYTNDMIDYMFQVGRDYFETLNYKYPFE